MNYLFIINPASGNNTKNNTEKIIHRFAGKQKLVYKIYKTKGSGDKSGIQHLIKNYKPTAIIVAGGDGTINLVGSLIINKQISLGILPTGSANGLARSLNIPNNINKALEKTVQDKPKSLDAILLNNEYYCFHLSDTGINARVVKRSEDEDSKGILGYGKQFIKEICSKKQVFRFTLNVKDKTKKMKAEMVIIANTKNYGTGAIINPFGIPNDGNFEIIIIKPYPWWQMIKIAFFILIGRFHKLQNVKVVSSDNAKIEFNKPRTIQIDGELVEQIRIVNLQIIPEAISVFYK